MNISVTDEYALDKIKKALAIHDYGEADKWRICLRGNTEVRLAWKQKVREAKEANLQARLREMYSRP